MRRSYTKTHKKIKGIKKRNTLSYKTSSFGYSRRIRTDFDNIKQVLNKSTIAKCSWKVMPKDSCEVYKNRRKRQIEKKNSDGEREDSTSNEKDTTGDGCRCRDIQRDDSSRSSYSSDSVSETSYSLTDSDN